jgi:hypothetical protein
VSAWLRPSTTTDMMMERAFDIPQRKHPSNLSYVSRHVVPMS